MPKKYDQQIAYQMEHHLAAALLVDPDDYFPRISGVVKASDFKSPMARSVYEAVEALLKEKKPADPYSIVLKANKMDIPLDEEFCKQAMKLTPTLVNTEAYAEAVHEHAVSSAEDDVGMKLMQGELTSSEAVAELQDLMRAKKSVVESPADAASKMMDFINNTLTGNAPPYVPTKFPSLDKILSGGLVAGGLITLAARPGTGKTTAGICIAENVALSGIPVLYVSLEMTATQIWTCRIANYGCVNRSEIYTGNYSGSDKTIEGKLRQVTLSVEKLSKVPFYVRDVPSTVEDVEKDARSIPNLGLIVIDHIGLLRPSNSGGGRYEIMTDISHRLKQLALSMQIPILALCQLNRMSMERKNHRPTMADLRDSGAIEEDSDCVMLLFRDDSVTDTSEKQKILFIIDKNRHGMTGDVAMNFLGSMSKITE